LLWEGNNQMDMVRRKSDKARINEFIEAVMQVAKGDYYVQLAISDENNILDSLAMGLNMMIDDIRNSAEIERQNEKIKLINDELLAAKEKAEESDRLKSAFLANMSHEIRTPMNGILGFADLLKKPELSGEQQQKYIEVIEKSGERMLNIINDLIDISKIESGQMGISRGPARINEQIEFVYAFFKPDIKKKGMQISYDIPLSDEKATIITDREKLYAILLNLVRNAIKYSCAGSIDLGYSKKGDFLEFYVKDQGIGIAREKQKEIFDRFVQAETSMSRIYEGAGLGLAISKAYVEMLGGRIWVISELGKGSQFYFTIPYITGERVQNDELNGNSIPDDPDTRKLKVLIVEDNEASDMLLTSILEIYGHYLLHAANGTEAVEICRNNPDIDLILMDMKMPKMSGFESARLIRKFNKRIIIIAQTAFAMPSDRDKALDAGCDDYIEKPIRSELLMTKINLHFRKFT